MLDPVGSVEGDAGSASVEDVGEQQGEQVDRPDHQGVCEQEVAVAGVDRLKHQRAHAGMLKIRSTTTEPASIAGKIDANIVISGSSELRNTWRNTMSLRDALGLGGAHIVGVEVVEHRGASV